MSKIKFMVHHIRLENHIGSYYLITQPFIHEVLYMNFYLDNIIKKVIA